MFSQIKIYYEAYKLLFQIGAVIAALIALAGVAYKIHDSIWTSGYSKAQAEYKQQVAEELQKKEQRIEELENKSRVDADVASKQLSDMETRLRDILNSNPGKPPVQVVDKNGNPKACPKTAVLPPFAPPGTTPPAQEEPQPVYLDQSFAQQWNAIRGVK